MTSTSGVPASGHSGHGGAAAYGQPAEPRGSGSTAWLWFVTIGVLATVGYYVLPGFRLGGTGQQLMVIGMAAAAGLAVLAGVRLHQPVGRTPWVVLALAQLCVTVAAALSAATRQVVAGRLVRDLPEMFLLGRYALIAVALVLVIRRRTPRWYGAALLDALIVAIAAALPWWLYLVGPLGAAPEDSAVAVVARVGYPVLELLVLAVALRLALGAGARSPAFRLLLGSVAVMLAAGLATALGGDAELDGSGRNALRLGAFVLLGAAALHPSMRWLDQRALADTPPVTTRRTVLLAGACLVPLVVLLVQHYRSADLVLPAIAAAWVVLFLLMLVRMRGLARAERRHAIVDELTGLLAYDFIVRALQVECDRIEGTRDELAVLLIDADHLGLVNDAYGPAAGDLVVRQLADRVQAVSRPGDLVARYDGPGGDGDTMMVILPGVDAREAPMLAERIRDAVSAVPIQLDDADRVRLTVSIGMVRAPADARTGDQLRAMAARALYAAKAGGRNRTVGRHGPINPELLARQWNGGQHAR